MPGITLLNNLYYYYRRHKWIFSWPFANSLPDNEIDRPVFIVGHQGNGATLVSRIIRRANDVITFSGNSQYFAGADEMQSGMGMCLDYRLTGLLHKMPKSNKFGSRRGWSYACNEMLPFYKFDMYDCDAKISANIKKSIKAAILSNRLNKNTQRFVDKSQSYAIKISLINEALKNHNPLFIAIVRNPLAVCWRAAYLKTGLSNEHISAMERLRISVEHWNNSADSLLEQQGKKNFLLVKIEDILQNLDVEMKKIFDFTGIEFNEKYMPRANDKLPFGTKRSERWFPVKKEINEKYIQSLPLEIKEYIQKNCEINMKKLGYHS